MKKKTTTKKQAPLDGHMMRISKAKCIYCTYKQTNTNNCKEKLVLSCKIFRK